jgi:hypothetical protein
MIDWTQVLVTGIPATIAALCSGAALIIVALNRRTLKTPSGQGVGRLTEESWELARTHTEHLKALEDKANGG